MAGSSPGHTLFSVSQSDQTLQFETSSQPVNRGTGGRFPSAEGVSIMFPGVKPKHSLKAFVCDTRNTVAVILGICAIPIVIAASIGLDMASSSHMKSEIQA